MSRRAQGFVAVVVGVFRANAEVSAGNAIPTTAALHIDPPARGASGDRERKVQHLHVALPSRFSVAALGGARSVQVAPVIRARPARAATRSLAQGRVPRPQPTRLVSVGRGRGPRLLCRDSLADAGAGHTADERPVVGGLGFHATPAAHDDLEDVEPAELTLRTGDREQLRATVEHGGDLCRALLDALVAGDDHPSAPCHLRDPLAVGDRRGGDGTGGTPAPIATVRRGHLDT